MRRERGEERGDSRERNSHPNSNSNSNQKPNSNSNSNQNPNSKSNPIKLSTIYVSNLPSDLDIYGLRGIFARIGAVVEAAIPGSQEGNRRFGFVRFKDHADVGKSIKAFNNRVIRGYRICVQKARRDCVRVRKDKPRKCGYQKSGFVQNQSFESAEREVDFAMLLKIKSCLAAEFGKIEIDKKIVDSFMEKLDELFASKSPHPKDVAEESMPAKVDSFEEDPEENYESDDCLLSLSSIPKIFSSNDVVGDSNGVAVQSSSICRKSHSQLGEVPVEEERRVDLPSVAHLNFCLGEGFGIKERVVRRVKRAVKKPLRFRMEDSSMVESSESLEF